MSTDDRFQRFDEAIQLSSTDIKRVESAFERLSGHLTKQYGLSADQVFIQGSYANGTVVTPIKDRDFDVDVVAVCATADDSPEAALEKLEAQLSVSQDYDDRIDDTEPTPSCVRLHYAGNFHVDVVPLRPATDAPLEVPKRDSGWRGTAPREYTEWCREEGEDFLRMVRMLKRWRDYHQKAHEAVKSITFQVIIWNCLAPGDDGKAILETFKNIQDWLDQSPNSPIKVENPVLKTENLADGWEDEAYQKFRDEIDEAVAIAGAALESGETSDWQKLFGDSFPARTVKAGMVQITKPKPIQVQPRPMIRVRPPGLPLGDTTHYKRLHEQTSLRRKSTVRKIPISHEVYIEQAGGRRVIDPVWRQGMPIPPDRYIKYTAEIPFPHTGRIWWQVVNTGEHAERASCPRGDVQRTNSTVHWEPTAYHGKHWVECYFVTKDGFIVAESRRHYVDIVHPDYT